MKTFEVTYTEKWIEKQLDYQVAKSHNEVAKILPRKSVRIYNDKFRQIEKTGKYYRITEMCKGGKSFIFELKTENP